MSMLYQKDIMTKYRTLELREQMYLCEFIGILVPIARSAEHPMSELARRQISLTMWRWTADGVDARGIVHQDALKYSTSVHAVTDGALEALRNGSAGLRHEHVVPRAWLTARIVEENLQGRPLCDFLSRFCCAAIITKKEDGMLKPRAGMPDGWAPDRGNIYQRYIDAGLFETLRNARTQ